MEHCILFSWRSKQSKPAVQIDLIIECADEIVNLCEIKYSKGKYTITAKEEEILRNRVNDFEQETGIKTPVLLTMITIYGLNENSHSSEVAARLDMQMLFDK